MSQPNRLQYILAIIVAITWLGVTFIPFFSPNENDVRVAVGVQAAMMLVLGAIFGKNIFSGKNDGDNDS
jgi:uncharacterized protein (DUF697 family)